MAESLSEVCDVRQLDNLFILYSLLAELSGRDSPLYASYCLVAHAVVMQIWQVCMYLYAVTSEVTVVIFNSSLLA